MKRMAWLLAACAITSARAVGPPSVEISNGLVRATVYLPDSDRGYYRGGRFDWSGAIARLEYAGHNFFGVWFPRYEPTLNDAITGPVEEFRSKDGGLGFGEAKPRDPFIKIGVGALIKPDDKPYQFWREYRIVSTGTWVVRPEADSVQFTQELRGENGYGYVYTKTVRLLRGKPELVLEHSLRNTGKRVIETDVYDHDFYVIDGQPTGPAYSIHLPFAPKPAELIEGKAKVDGNTLAYTRELSADGHESLATDLTGFDQSAKDYDIRVENSNVRAGVEQTSDRPLAKLYLWSVRSTVCPEAYIALRVEPKKTTKWRIRYRFYTW